MSDIYRHNGYKFIYKEDMSIEEWLDTRKDGVGGSDVSVIMGLNPWQSELRLFYEKLSLTDPVDLEDNDSVFWGRTDEETIRKVSQSYDVDNPDAYKRNFTNKVQLHTHVDVPFFIINEDYPWLQANVDGFGLNNTIDLEYSEKIKSWIFSGQLPKLDKIIEIKTIQGRSADSWDIRIPPGYIAQVLTYMLVCQKMNPNIYGEIYSRVDGLRLEYFSVDYNLQLTERIISKTQEFHERVTEARRALKGFSGDINEAIQICSTFEPEPDYTQDYSKFYSEKELIKQDAQKKSIKGDSQLLEMCVNYQRLGVEENEIKGERQYLSNCIKHWLRKNDTSIATFEEGRKVSFNKRLYINI